MVTHIAVSCSVCGLSTRYPLTNEKGEYFCCPSCREVAALLAEASPQPEAAILQSEKELQEVTLTLGDMWCPSCAWLVENHLKRSAGVAEAQVNFIQQQASLKYDPSRTDPRRLKARIRQLGYHAALPEEKPHDEEESLYYRLVICGVLALHDVLVGFSIYGREWIGLNTPESEPLIAFFRLMMFLTALPVLVLLGFPILRAGLSSLLRGQPNLHTLITIGTFAAFSLSVYNLFNGKGEVYFDTASMLLFLVAVGRWLEIQAHKTARDVIQRLLRHFPEHATRLTPEGEETIPLKDLKPGMRLRVRPGERFPVDGVIAVGEGDVDQSLLTGESKPVPKRVGDTVQAGTISLDGAFEVIAYAVGESTTAGQIVRLLHQALWQRSPLERLADRLAAWMMPLALGLAGIAFFYWNVHSTSEQALMIALSVLLIACPCALGLATPLTLWLGIQRAAESGALLRSTAALERLARVQHVFFDKTGTLTVLPMQVEEVIVATQDSERSEAEVRHEFLRYVASAEEGSEHPIGKAIVTYAQWEGIPLQKIESLTALPGRGVKASWNGLLLWVGSERLMAEQGLVFPENLKKEAERLRATGKSVIFGGWHGRVHGLISLDEKARLEAAEALQQLRTMGLEVTILTGDELQVGQQWERKLGVPVRARLTPQEKMHYLQEAGEKTAMVGDGINDGPALATASVGIALSQSTDVARLTAEVVLLREDLRLLGWLIRLSRTVMRRVHENLGWAFIYNLIGLGMAMAGLLQPVFAALAMVLSSLLVTANALRMQRFPSFESNFLGVLQSLEVE